MKMAILAVVLAAVSGWAWAQQWVRVSRNALGVSYIDPGTIRINGDRRRYWHLVDLEKPDRDGGLSYRFIVEIDCKEERSRPLQGATFRGRMLDGGILVSHHGPFDWSYVAPGTPDAAAMRFVCSH